MLNTAIKESVKRLIDEKMKRYNPETGLLKEFFAPNYHSYLKPGEYHFINNSVNVAAAVFSCEYEEYYEAAKGLLWKALSLQRKTGELEGLWSYFLEESLEEMVQPDWNYADFNAYPMLYLLKEHADRLDSELREAMKEACCASCRAILRRNLAVDYTNPTVMGIYCTVLCGTLFHVPEFVAYGKKKLNKLYFRVMNAGAYEEYNCPTYSMLVADLYSLILRHIEEKEVVEKVTVLNHILWRMLGEHYHFELGELTGPHLRQYTEFLSPNSGCAIQNAVSAELGIAPPDQAVLFSALYQTECPEEEKPLFLKRNKSEAFRRIITPGAIYSKFYWPQVDTQYITPRYTVGSISMSDCWNQRRNVVAYIGDKEKKVSIRLRAYLDGYDFSSGFSSTAQHGGVALSITNFHTDWGKTHPTLDPVIDAKFMAKDVRILYQIKANTHGIIEEITTEKTASGYRLEVLGTAVEIQFPYAAITGGEPYMELQTTEDEMLLSMVLYSGEETEIDFNALESMAIVSVLSVGETTDSPAVKEENGFITAKLAAGAVLEVKSSGKPLKQMHSSLLNEILIDGVNVLEAAERENE